ncbi:hypothetical protein [Rhodoferax sp. U11-2br]|uniref:hypothetical protein n=1 Tax=Rhodoferax sp. U11-2br TaxID=2838878 RepID=UPI001BE97A3C|nr:hypothetical protein [Rhodoferax sp. U11-2br]MBT3067819.1 hypothetical protein [Rhodoferax sp. U11-2br]
MNTKRWSIALIVIATSAFSTWARAENIYKCGTSYSQSPCPGGKLLDVNDNRDPQQKKLKDDITQRDAELARDMEKDRLAKEKAMRATEVKRALTPTPPTQVVVVREEPVLVHPKRLKHKTAKQLGFVAEVPEARRPPTKKKPAKKTAPKDQP